MRRRVRTLAGLLIASALPVMSVVGLSAPSGAGPAATAYATSDFVTNLPDVPPPSPYAGVGPIGLAFDGSDHLLVSDAANLGFYSVGASGSDDPQPVSVGSTQGNLAFGTTGQLFATEYQAGDLDQIDPATGAIIRQLNPPDTSYPCILGLATDPVTGDLFFSQPDSGGVCPGSTTITRVEDPTSPTPIFTTFINLATFSADGLAFGLHGSLYAVVQSGTLGCADLISGTKGTGTPTATSISCVTGPGDLAGIDSITVSTRPPGPPTLFVGGPDGTIRMIDQSTSPPTVTAIATGGTREDALAVGPDGCLYASQSTAIEKITPSSGPCSFVAASVLPSLRLRPDALGTAITGKPVTVRARLESLGHPLAAPVQFTVTGANPTTAIVSTDASGIARFTYRGTNSGADSITATTTVDGTVVASNPSTVQWTDG
jgi:hypothetical protein